jgi:hypothetical protein
VRFRDGDLVEICFAINLMVNTPNAKNPKPTARTTGTLRRITRMDDSFVLVSVMVGCV